MPHPTPARNHHIPRHANKQPMLDDAGPRFKLARQARRIGDRAKVGIEDEVALVSLEGRVAVQPQRRRRAAGVQVARLRLPAEGNDLDGDRPACAQLAARAWIHQPR